MNAQPNDDKARENRLRRKAKKQGYVLRKSRARNWSLDNQQGYILIDPHYNVPVLHSSNFDLSLDDVEEFLKDSP